MTMHKYGSDWSLLSKSNHPFFSFLSHIPLFPSRPVSSIPTPGNGVHVGVGLGATWCVIESGLILLRFSLAICTVLSTWTVSLTEKLIDGRTPAP